MNYAGVLAGGSGTRMGKTDLPKQFLNIGDKPIIIHTVEQFLLSSKIDQVIIAVPENWLTYTQDIVDKYFKGINNVKVTSGGTSRNETIMNICKYIENNFGTNPDDNIITHDAVRPFVTTRIIEDNIEMLKKYSSVDTVIPATDTIVESRDEAVISSIPNRNYLYQGQTPQSFNIGALVEEYNKLTDIEKETLTDACKIFVIKDKEVGCVMGETYNFKITNQFDYKMANFMVTEGESLAQKGELTNDKQGF